MVCLRDWGSIPLCTTVPPPSALPFSLKTAEKELRSSATAPKKTIGRSGGHGDTTLQTGEHVVAMARTRRGEYLPLTSKALHTIVKAGAIPADFDCLCPFKRPKDHETTAQFANYQHQYVLDDTGGGVSTGATYRRVGAEISGNREGPGYDNPAPRGGGGARSRSLLLSKNSRINKEVLAAVRSMAVAIERSKLCRVLRLDSEFVLDEKDELWLVGVTSCEVAARPALASPPHGSADQQGRGHLGGAECALATELRSKKHEVDETSGVPSDDEFSQLLHRVGYRSPNKRRVGGGTGRHHRRPPATLSSTIQDATATGVHAQNGADSAVIPRDDAMGSLHRVVSDTERWPHGPGSRGSVASSAGGFDWASPGSSEGSATSDLGVETKGGAGGATGRPPSPPRPEPVEMFNSSIVKLDQAATNRMYGSTQVRTKG